MRGDHGDGEAPRLLVRESDVDFIGDATGPIAEFSEGRRDEERFSELTYTAWWARSSEFGRGWMAVLRGRDAI